MLPPSKWPNEELEATFAAYIRLIEVYVDDFCTMAQTTDINQLQHVSRSLLHAIHSVFPSTDISGHTGGPILEKSCWKERGMRMCVNKSSTEFLMGRNNVLKYFALNWIKFC